MTKNSAFIIYKFKGANIMLKRNQATLNYKPVNKDSDMEEILFRKYKPSKKKTAQYRLVS